MINGIINVYKERGFTSFDVVAKLRGILHERKIGHTGTLDPEATGVLPVCIGNATKVCELLTDKDKVYRTVMHLGITTDTQDMTGTVKEDRSREAALLKEQTVEAAISQFVGDYEQIPPMYSALKVNGKKLLKQNVRDFLGFSKVVNQAIKSTLLDKDKRDDFFFLNNGITMVCEKIDYSSGSESTRARLSNVQIINGGQTSKTIQNVVDENPNINFSDTFVLVRVYQIDMSKENEFVNAITTATNSQNAIYAKDLKANDEAQQKIEQGLKQYDIEYLRRRDQRRARPQDIRMDMVAEVLLSCILQKPEDAKYRKSLHFTEEYYSEIFNTSKINAELIYFSTTLFKKIESKRKAEQNTEFPFVVFASHYVLMLVYKQYIKKYGEISHINIDNSLKWLVQDELLKSIMFLSLRQLVSRFSS
jgi:hypothetical protein